MSLFSDNSVTLYLLRNWIGLLLLMSSVMLHCRAAHTHQEVHEKIDRDYRVMRDVSALDFIQIKPNESWIIAEVMPKPSQGYISGQYVRSGKVFTPPNRRSRVLSHGSIRIIKTLAGTPPKLTHYKWDREASHVVNRLDSDEIIYGPFSSGGGTAILRVNESEELPIKFRPVYFIPPEWSSFAVSATAYFQRNANLFHDKLAFAHQEQLRLLLLHENPFIAVAAARILGRLRSLDIDLVKGTLTQTTGVRQAIFTVLLLTYALPQRRPVLTEEICKVIEAADDAGKIRGLVLGIYAALNSSEAFDFSLLQWRKELLTLVDKKQMELGSRTADDSYIISMLTLSGLRQEISSVTSVNREQ